MLQDLCSTDWTLERHSIKRSDPSWVAEQLNSANCRFILNCQNRYAVDSNSQLTLFDRKQVETTYHLDESNYCFIGELSTNNETLMVFCAEISTESQSSGQWLTLRETALDDPLLISALTAQGLLTWHRQTKYCSACAAKLKRRNGGHSLKCINHQCKVEYFPRINPAIIVLLTRDDQCLLANAYNFKGDIPMHSCLAGYVESGEDFEMTVRREVAEEVGIELGAITYIGNQPWPFPQSLMIGFQAEALSKETTFHDGEIRSAAWFTPIQLVQAITNEEIQLPSMKSIAFILIDRWYQSQTGKSISSALDSHNE